MTNFSIPSIALSNSTSDALFQTSHSRIRSEMNFDHDSVTYGTEIYALSTHVQEVIDQLDLVIDRERPLREVTQEPK